MADLILSIQNQIENVELLNRKVQELEAALHG